MLNLNKTITIIFLVASPLQYSFSQITLEKEVLISNDGLYFDGTRVQAGSGNAGDEYDYVFGPRISAHGDCLKKFKDYVFVSWYEGGKTNRQMMLSRYNIKTGSIKTIEFPHRHTGHNNLWWLGESHNTIGVGISPLDGTIHLIFDMHAYSQTIPNGAFPTDYFRYAYTVKNAVAVSDDDFTLDLFGRDEYDGDYSHCSLNGVLNHAAYERFTYPKFFLNDAGDLFMYMRKWSSSNGGYHFAKYEANTSTWSDFIKFADYHASDYGQTYDWGMYGNMKYVNGKIRVGFQRRWANRNDKYLYQNGFYYAYSDDQSGKTQWKNHKGENISIPLRDADVVKVSEPGDLVTTQTKDKVHMVGGYDWNVTEKGDVHMIGKVKDNEKNVTKYVHTYRPTNSSDFITTTDFAGGEKLYTSGDFIYIIGLNSMGRIYIEQADGGENNFLRVYEATSGKKYSHGVAYVYDGKLYYYLQERSTGDARPLYLQIIDLGLGSNQTTSINIHPNNEAILKVSIYPNPIDNLLDIDLGPDIFAIARIRIVDISGKTVLEQELHSDQLQINVGDLQEGLHTIIIYLGTEILSSKFIKI